MDTMARQIIEVNACRNSVMAKTATSGPRRTPKHQVTRVTPSLRHKNCLKSVSRQDTVSRLALRRWWSGHPGSNWPSHHWANQNATALWHSDSSSSSSGSCRRQSQRIQSNDRRIEFAQRRASAPTSNWFPTDSSVLRTAALYRV